MQDPAQEPQWYVARDGKRFGPMTQADLWRLANDSQIQPDDHVWRQGFDDWISAATIPGLLDTPATAPHPPATAPDNPPPREEPVYQQQQNAFANHSTNSHPVHDIGAVNLDSGEPEHVQHQNWQANQQPDLRADPHAAANEHGYGQQIQPAPNQDAQPEFQIEPQASYETSFSGEPATAQAAPYYQQEKRGGGLKKILYFAAVAMFLIVVAGIAIPFVVPADAIRDQIVHLIKQETGRDVIVRGKTSVAFFPNIGVKLTDIALSNPSGMAGEPLLRMAALTVDLKLMPLFSGQVEFASFILKTPRISLYIDQSGRNNWDVGGFITKIEKVGSAPVNSHPPLHALTDHFTRPTAAQEWPDTKPDSSHIIELAQTSITAQAVAKNTSSSFVKDLSLGDVRIIDGTVSYADERSGTRHTVSKIDLALNMETLNDPLNAEGTGIWRGKTIAINATLDTPGTILNNGDSPLKFTFESEPLTGRFNGKIANSETIAVTGKVTANASEFSNVLHWLSPGPKTQASSGKFALSSNISATPQKIDLENISLNLDKTNAKGLASIKLEGERPFIQATLNVDQMDLNKYFRFRQKKVATQTRKQSAQVQPEQKSLTALIQEINEPGISQPVFKPDAATTGTMPSRNDAKLKLASLKTVDAEIALTIAKIYYHNMSIGQSNLDVKVTDGQLNANLKELQLYGGLATGEFVLSSNAPVPTFQSTLSIQGVSALPFLRDAASFDWVSGRANITMNINGRGNTTKDIKKSLEGTGSIAFTDGAIEGLNIPQMIRNLQKGQISGLSREKTQKTDFSQFTGSFVMQQGIATNKDLKLVGPLLRATGAGNIDLTREWIDYQISPKLVASLEGQGAEQALAGIEIPVKIQGPWKKPNIIPDAAALLKNPQALSRGIEAIGRSLGALKKKKKITSKDFEAIINNVLGKKTKKRVAKKQQPNDDAIKKNQAIETNKLLKELLAQ